MFNATGNAQVWESHETSSNDSNGSAWSLTKITTPLGSKINVNYERDTYSSISGNPPEVVVGFSNSNISAVISGSGAASPNSLTVQDGSKFQPGDVVKITGTSYFSCQSTSKSRTLNAQTFTVASVSGNILNFGTDFFSMAADCGGMSGTAINISSQSGTVYKLEAQKKGGDIRVGSIVYTDDFSKPKKQRYIYLNDAGHSSGVVSQEPEFIQSNYEFNSLTGYPQTGVLYSKVAVLQGDLTTDLDYYSKDVYEFETPHSDMFALTKTIVAENGLASHYTAPDNKTYSGSYRLQSNTVVDRTSKIGTLKSIKHYNVSSPTPVSSTTMTYTDQLTTNGSQIYQGVYSEGVIMFDYLTTAYHTSTKANRTTVVRYPWVLKTVVDEKGGLQSKVDNKDWDQYTAAVLDKLETSPQGMKIRTVTVPGYIKYPEFGSKAEGILKKNMLGTMVSTATYRSDAFGNMNGLISASAQTWKNDWANYRVFNGTTQVFGDTVEGPNVWRPYASYLYTGTYSSLLSDGTLKYPVAEQFNFSSPGSNTNWKLVSTMERMSHYSKVLQSVDMTGIYSSSKTGYNDAYVIAEAGNAKYNEIAFSSAEDLRSDIAFFGGEVGLGSGTVKKVSKAETAYSHTGDAVLHLTSGYGFVTKPTELRINKSYRAMVWTNATSGQVYYKLNGGSEVLSPVVTPSTQIGNWYLIDLIIPIGGTFTSLEVGVKSAGSAACLFDDFRFQPMEASMTAYVPSHPSLEFIAGAKKFEYTLDNDNLFTKYEYDVKGNLSKVYAENLKFHAVKLLSESKLNFRRATINQ